MDIYIDHEKLRVTLIDFNRLTQLRISFWDHKGRHCLSGEQSCSQFCRKIQSNPALFKQCNLCENEGIEKAKAEPMKLHHFHCHAGMHEFIFPVMYDDMILGYFMYGQVCIADMMSDSSTRYRIYEAHDLDSIQMEGLYQDLPAVSLEYMQSAGRMLGNLAVALHLNGLIEIRRSQLSDRIKEYIEQNHHLPLKIDNLSRYFSVSTSTISHALAKERDTTFVRMLNNCRIKSVKQYLRHGDSISEATYKSGFNSENYMTRVFRQSEAITPSQYRDSMVQD